MATSFDPVVSLSFGAKIFKSFEGEAKSIIKARVGQDQALQSMLDAFWVACDKPKAEFLKGNAATNAARYQVKVIFDRIVEAGFLSKSSGASYQSAFWIAFEKGIPFQRDLNNKKSTGDKGEAKPPNAGGTETTDVPALHRTLSKSLAQARLLNQSLFVADLTDLILETWPDFQETVMAKK